MKTLFFLLPHGWGGIFFGARNKIRKSCIALVVRYSILQNNSFIHFTPIQFAMRSEQEQFKIHPIGQLKNFGQRLVYEK